MEPNRQQTGESLQARPGMARKGQQLTWPDLGPRDGACGLTEMAKCYLRHMEAKNLSPHTITGHRQSIRRFLEWCADRGIATPKDLGLPELESFQYFLSRYQKKGGGSLTQRSQRHVLDIVRSLMVYGHKREWIDKNPAEDLELPKVPKPLPMHSLAVKEVEEVLKQPDVRKPTGLRDRAMLELIYSTGLRRSELVNLQVGDIEYERGLIRVHKGKGNKDRVVPIGKRALQWLKAYLSQARPLLAAGGESILFVTAQHKGVMNAESLTHRFGRYVRRVNKKGACHIFRHTMATLMLDGGADIRFVQEMLGHSSLSTTQIYTHVSVEKLRKVHERTHPAENPMAAIRASEDAG